MSLECHKFILHSLDEDTYYSSVIPECFIVAVLSVFNKGLLYLIESLFGVNMLTYLLEYFGEFFVHTYYDKEILTLSPWNHA